MSKKLFSCVALFFFSYCSHAQLSAGYSEWVKKANAFYQAKQYKQSTDAYTQAFASLGGKGLPNDRYNAACAWSLSGNNDSAFFQLNRIATKSNFTDYNHLVEDADLESLHKDKRWDELCNLVKQNKEKAEVNLNKPLVAILDTIFQNDQGGRMQIREIQKYGSDSKEMKDLWKTISYYDSVDLIKVVSILDKYGWPGPDIVGARGSQTVFLVIQHADTKTQQKYLPMMREAVKNKKATPSDLALLEDRVAIREGRKQIYGSQITMDKEGSFLAPMEDPANVDKRRAEAGLGTLADYLQYFNITWDIEAYQKQLPDIEKRQKNIHYN